MCLASDVVISLRIDLERECRMLTVEAPLKLAKWHTR
jgi:hypothetical protein